MKLYLAEFPDFDNADEAEALLAIGMEDVSWHNDAMPSFTVPGLRVWVDYADHEKSEFCHDADDGNRIAFSYVDDEGQPLDDAGEDPQFKTVAEAMPFIRKHMEGK